MSRPREVAAHTIAGSALTSEEAPVPNSPPPTTAMPSHHLRALMKGTPSIGTAVTLCSASTIRGLRETTLMSVSGGSSCSARASIASSPVLPLPKLPMMSTRVARGETELRFSSAAWRRPRSASCWRIRLVRGSVIEFLGSGGQLCVIGSRTGVGRGPPFTGSLRGGRTRSDSAFRAAGGGPSGGGERSSTGLPCVAVCSPRIRRVPYPGSYLWSYDHHAGRRNAARHGPAAPPPAGRRPAALPLGATLARSAVDT